MKTLTTDQKKLVEDNIGLVFLVAKPYSYHYDYDDILSSCKLELCRAVARYDNSKGCKISSFLVPCLKGAVRHYFRDKTSLIRTPRGKEGYIFSPLKNNDPTNLNEEETIGDYLTELGSIWPFMPDEIRRSILIMGKHPGLTNLKLSRATGLSIIDIRKNIRAVKRWIEVHRIPGGGCWITPTQASEISNKTLPEIRGLIRGGSILIKPNSIKHLISSNLIRNLKP